MKYSKYNQSNISNFFHNFDSAKSQINYDFLAISTDEYKNKVPCQINNFSYFGTNKVILDKQILISHGSFQKNLITVQEQILGELIVWEMVFDVESLRSGIFF